jgi:hypothetical protein
MPAIKIGAVENKYSILPEGSYEVYINKIDPVTDFDGIETSRIMFTVRSDVGGAFSKYNVFTNIRNSWGWMLNGISKALGIPTDTEYEALEDFLEDIKGRSLVVKVKHKPNPKDATKPYVNVTDFYPTSKGNFKLETDTTDSSII